jgi:DNA-binding NarL/FixJ family response regulator
VLQPTGELERGRDAYARSAWAEVDVALGRAGELSPLAAEDLERHATAAYMLGRQDDYLARLERAHHAYSERGETRRAVRCAFWLAVALVDRGEPARAGGWLSRAQRLLETDGGDCVEQAYLLVPEMFREEACGDFAAAAATAARMLDAAQRFDDSDLFALALQSQGRFLVLAGDVAEGLRLLDEAMVAVAGGEVSPIPSGIVYCGVITGCDAARDVRRAHEWTATLTRWCERQPDMLAFTGRCLVHRAELLQLRGAWADALEEARRAGQRCAQLRNARAAAEAAYRRAEVHRLRGEVARAEAAYREAADGGREPQPGLALLRLAQGDGDAAASALRRELDEERDRAARADLLSAAVEVMLSVGDLDAARDASRELDGLAARHGTELLLACAAQAAGAVALAEADPAQALAALRRAGALWQQLEVPYEAARVRALVGRACRALGDEETAARELRAARETFRRLGAGPDAAALAEPDRSAETHGLTARELQVLRLVAAGATNRSIAAQLILSERTVDRHVSNILAKLRVSSRAAATAYSYEHELL